MRLKTTDGLDLYMEKRPSEVTGSSPICVIFSHGLSGSGRNWRSSVNELSDQPGVLSVYYDLRGHGRSPGLNQLETYSLDRLAKDLIEVTQYVGAEHPDHDIYLVGLSLGAMVSLRACHLMPELYKGLCMTSMPCLECPTSIARYAHDFARDIRAKGLEGAGETYVWGADSGMKSQDAFWVKQGFLEHKDQDIAFLLDEALAKLPSAETSAHQIQQLLEKNISLALFVGDEDQSALMQRRLMQDVWQKSLEGDFTDKIFEKGKHVLNLTSPKAFNQALLEWLKLGNISR